MTLTLRTRLLLVVLPSFALVGGAAAVSGPIWLAGVAAAVGVAAGATVVALTAPFERLRATAGRVLGDRAAGVPAGDGASLVNQALAVQGRDLDDARRRAHELEHQFDSALTKLATTLKEVATNWRTPASFAAPASPWPDRSAAVAAAVVEVLASMTQLARRGNGFQGVLNDLPDPVLVLDAKKQVIFANTAAGRLFGGDPVGLNRRSMSALFRDPGLDLWDDGTAVANVTQLTGLLDQGRAVKAEAIAATPDDHGTRVSVAGVPAADRSVPRATVLLLKDLTSQKQTDADVRLHHRRTVAQRLCLLVENDTRPALESIRTAATLLAQTAKQIGQRERFLPKVERMMDELSRQEVVITLLGWLGRLTKTFGSSQDLSEVRLRDRVDEVADKLKAVFGDRSNTVGVTGDAGWLIADEEWVTVLLTGLLLHANMNAKQEAVKVELRRRSAVMADREQGEILVRYRGTPLPADAVADVKEPFRRPNSVALDSISELGFPLGLAVANRIAGLMGGQLELEAEGAECVARVLLPTRATGSRVDGMAAAVRVAAAPAVEAEPTDVLGDWLVGGGKAAAAESVDVTTPAPVGVTTPAVGEPGETLGDWFPASAD